MIHFRPKHFCGDGSKVGLGQIKCGSKVGSITEFDTLRVPWIEFGTENKSKWIKNLACDCSGSKIGSSVYYVTNILFIRGIDLFKMSKVRKFDYSKNLIKQNLTAYFSHRCKRKYADRILKVTRRQFDRIAKKLRKFNSVKLFKKPYQPQKVSKLGVRIQNWPQDWTFLLRWNFIGWNGWRCGWHWCVGVQKSVDVTLESAFTVIIAIFLNYQEIFQLIQKFYSCKTTDWQIHCSWNKNLLAWQNWKDWNFSTTI